MGIQLRNYPYLTNEFLKGLADAVSKKFNDKKIEIFSLQDSIDLEVCGRFKRMLEKNGMKESELKELINDMQRVFATKVSAIGNDNKGRIYIDYYSRDDLDRLADMIELLKKKEITLGDLRNYNKRHPNG